MTPTIRELPNDIDALKRIIVDQQLAMERLIADQQLAIERMTVDQQQTIERIEREHAAAIAALLRRYYGPRSERFDPRQLLLFGQQLDQAELDTPSVEEEAGQALMTRRVRGRDRHGRGPLPEHLERIDIEHDLEDKACPACGDQRSRIGQEISEQLEYFPASLKVLRHIRHKYACGRCDREGYNPNIERAPKPAQPIDKGLPGPSLLAYVVTSKLADHLPLYRLEQIFARQQVGVARSTMCAWMRCAGELVRPLVDLMTDRIRRSRVIHTDDSPVPIQSPGAKQCRKGRIWCYLGDPDHPYIVYDYTSSRRRDGPAGWLTGYRGYLQADAYGGYDGIYHSQGVTEVACWAHARRKFYDAQDSDPRRAAEILALIGQLYAVEREAKEADEAARLELRQGRSREVLADIRTWLDAQQLAVLPRSPMSAAITYALNQWEALLVYATCGFLSIDNNASERALKRVALGRKNWLFAGNDAAAASHARLWSLIASCQRHGLDPQRYLTSVLAKIHLTPAADLGQFLPDVWKHEDSTDPLPQH
jgi:transposase